MTQPRVLLVEDDEGSRYALRVALERAGLQVDDVPDGKDALHLLNNAPDAYSCVLLDMLLPGVHGSSVVAHVARTLPRLAVVAVTGFPDRILFADPSHRHVVKAIFAKPVDPVDVAAYVKSRCRQITAAPSA
jgi:CheY-like chemotaxis protein